MRSRYRGVISDVCSPVAFPQAVGTLPLVTLELLETCPGVHARIPDKWDEKEPERDTSCQRW